MLSEILSAAAQAFNPPKIAAIVRDAFAPITNFIDSYLGYEDFELFYDGEPDLEKIQPKKIYFYRTKKNLYCMTKELGFGLQLSSKDIGQKAYNEFMDCLGDVEKKTSISPVSKKEIYKFLKLNHVQLGINESLHRNIFLPYHKFENNFIAKHQRIYKAYKVFIRGANNFATFAASQTGVRIAGIISATALAVASGGTIPAAMVGAYITGMGISIAQQAYSKVGLNRLDEEVILIKRYKHNNELAGIRKKFHKKFEPTTDNRSTVMKWLNAGRKHLSTYFFEAAIPIAAAAVSPLNTAMSAAQFGIFVGLSAIGVGAGIYPRKMHEDNKEKRQKEIKSLKYEPDVPNYKNLEDLRNIVFAQEDKLGIPHDPSLAKKSFFQEYKKALVDVVNPFKDYQIIPDLKILDKVARATTATGVFLAGIAGVASHSPELAAVALTTSVVSATSVNATRKYNCSAHVARTVGYEFDTEEDRQIAIEKAKLIEKQKLAETHHTSTIIAPNKGKVDLHPLMSDQEVRDFVEGNKKILSGVRNIRISKVQALEPSRRKDSLREGRGI